MDIFYIGTVINLVFLQLHIKLDQKKIGSKIFSYSKNTKWKEIGTLHPNLEGRRMAYPLLIIFKYFYHKG